MGARHGISQLGEGQITLNQMRTYQKRPRSRKLTPEENQAWRERLIAAINKAHGYPVASLQAMDNTKLVALRNRIGSRIGPSSTGKLPVNRHVAKLMA